MGQAAEKVDETQAEDPGISIVEVLPPAVPAVWSTVEPLIRMAIKSSEVTQRMVTTQDVLAQVMRRQNGLWAVWIDGEIKAAIVMGIEVHPRAHVVKIHLAGGSDLEHWIEPFYEYVVERARIANCRFVQIDGREPWGRKLKQYGFKKTSEVFTLEV